MSKKIRIPGLLFALLLILYGCTPVSSGENIHCLGSGTFDIVQENPLQVRFTCNAENSFEKILDGPSNEDLIDALRDNANNDYAGVVLNDDHQIIQLYIDNPSQILNELWRDLDSSE